MDFSKMTGYEFEDYISKILRNIGFTVTQTGYSHDGGIDLLAIYKKPLFSGKYIIQCKNYAGLVGQPEVRDLYGVIMSENANKGILITPSEYTEQAYDFARGKNIELINGETLSRIINEYADEKITIKKDGNETFNNIQYDYLIQCIDNEPTSPKFYLQAIEFLRNYIIEDDPCVTSADIFNKIIDLNMKLIKRCYKKKTDICYRKACWFRIAEIEIIRGNLGDATNILLDNDWFYIKNWLSDWYTMLKPDIPDSIIAHIYEPFCKCVLARNLYAAYNQIGFSFGCSEITKFININAELEKKEKSLELHYIVPNDLKQIKAILSKSVNDYSLFVDGEYDDTFMFSSVTPTKDGLRYQKSALNIKVKMSDMKKYYTKSDTDIIRDIDLSFKQHGIIKC